MNELQELREIVGPSATRRSAVIQRDSMWACGNEAEELVTLALFYGIIFVTLFALDFNLAFYENALE